MSRKAVGDGFEHDTSIPDVETSSEGYAARFDSAAGRWMLAVQGSHVSALLARAGAGPLRVLEVGGGHRQLSGLLVAAGHSVVVHGSRLVCHRAPVTGTVSLASEIGRLPFADRSFDLVVAIRLLAHVVEWQQTLAEMARVSRRHVLVDYPVRGAVHRLAPWLFGSKRKVEGNTRPYFDYAPGEVERELRSIGLGGFWMSRQFFWPMVLHRKLDRPRVSQRLEGAAAGLGLTRQLGSPCVLLAERRTVEAAESG